jgi:hypothetical protein
MSRKTPQDEQKRLDEQVASYTKAVEARDEAATSLILAQLLGEFGPRALEFVLASLVACRGENRALGAALTTKSALLNSVLAAPRKFMRLMGFVEEEGACWGVVSGPPLQAVRFHPGVDVAALRTSLEDDERRVWVWLVESAGGLVALGPVTMPPSVDAGLERELVFENVLDRSDRHDE